MRAGITGARVAAVDAEIAADEARIKEAAAPA